jgi:hypothetical protein
MILWSIKITVISIIIICIIHHLIFFLQNNFSIPKVKNFIDIPSKYKKMIDTISTDENVSLLHDLPVLEEYEQENKIEIVEIEKEENTIEIKDMKEELKQFVKNEL